jgi:hypothetical protein
MQVEDEDGKTYTVAAFVEGCLTCSDYDTGKLEDMDHTLDKTKEAVGALCEILVEKGVLGISEISRISKGYDDPDIRFVEEG